MKSYQIDHTFYACGEPVIVAENASGETHVYRASDRLQLSVSDMKFGCVFGGCCAGDPDYSAEEAARLSSSVTMESGFLWMLCGGGDGEGAVLEHAQVNLKGGMIAGYLYGAGRGDRVGSTQIDISGGAVKWGLYGAGEAVDCGRTQMHFQEIICTNVTTGTRNKNGVQHDGTEVVMDDGIVLNIYCGGPGTSLGDVKVTVNGGRIEKQIADVNQQGEMDITLWDGILVQGSSGAQFPMTPERAHLTWIPGASEMSASEKMLRTGTAAWHIDTPSYLDEVLDQTGEEGQLALRFFEIRDPNAPADSPFPQFIGDGYLISFPNGQHMLVDAGMPYAAPEIIANLRAMGIHKLDYVLISHHHGDHNGGIPEVLRNFEVGELIFPDAIVPLTDTGLIAYNEMVREIAAKKIPVRYVSRGDRLDVGETEILFLNPSKPHAVCLGLNDESVAMKINWKKSGVMLGADIGEETEIRLTDLYGDALKCDLLKASHHGIVYQNFYRYIDACSPKIIAFHSLRPQGVFLRTTRYALQHVHHMRPDQFWITGEKGAMKFVLDGCGGITSVSQYR